MAEGTEVMSRSIEHKTATLVGLTITLAIGTFLYYIGLFTSFYGMGFIFIGIVLLVIPRSFGCHNFRIMVLFGIVFFLIATIIGAFAVSKPMLEMDWNQPNNSNIAIQVERDGTANLSINYKNVANIEDIYVEFEKVTWVCYNQYRAFSDGSHQYKLDSSQDFWEVSDVKVSTDNVYFYTFFTFDELNEKRLIESGFYSPCESNIAILALETNAYYVGISAAIFMFILFFVREFKRNLDKTRAIMEAEGRLYPKGHGCCKHCGSIVLPGEIHCKKCGTAVDIPNKFQAKKTEFFQCSECNAEIPMNASTCPTCGVSFDEEDEIVFSSESIISRSS
ncbi:MAG: zinc ribbon domain-containing protein [archaeon]|nr:zinc ribbon domain-containing protein [archaeon]